MVFPLTRNIFRVSAAESCDSSFVGILGSGIIGALLLIFTGQLLALTVALMIGAAGTMMAVRKDPYTRISVVGQISDIIHFHKSQKQYKYIYTAPWDIK